MKQGHLIIGGMVATFVAVQGWFPPSLAHDKPDIAKGKKVFEQNCAACHGMKGTGDGPARKALTPKPRNFTKEAFKFGSTLEALTKTVESGSPGTAMVGWKGSLKPDQIQNVVGYVRTLIPKENLDKGPGTCQ